MENVMGSKRHGSSVVPVYVGCRKTVVDLLKKPVTSILCVLVSPTCRRRLEGRTHVRG